jgi:hypothetical protein
MAKVKKSGPRGVQRERHWQGQVVNPVLWNGRDSKYMAAEANGQLVLRQDGSPVPYRSCPQV